MTPKAWIAASMAAGLLGGAAGWEWADPNAGPVGYGNEAFGAGRIEEASRYYVDSIAGDDPGRGWFNQGVVLGAVKRPADAAEAFGRAAERLDGPEQAEAFYNLGTSLAEAGRLEDAVQALQRALAVKQDHEQARYNLALVLEWLKTRRSSSRQPPDPRTKPPDQSDLPRLLAEKERQGWSVLRRPPQGPRTPRVRDW